MKNTRFIPITDVSNYYHIEISILKDFAECELINIKIEDKTEYVLIEDLEKITLLKLKLESRRREYRYRFLELPNQRGLLIDHEE